MRTGKGLYEPASDRRDFGNLLNAAVCAGSTGFCQVKGGSQKVASPIRGDKAPAQTYYQFDSLSEQIDEAARAKDTKKVEALTERANELEKQLGPEYHALFDALNDADPNSKDVQDNTSKDNGSRKDKRPNIGPAAWRHQNRDALNEAHMPFDFDELFLLFFFVAITLLLAFDAPYPSKQWRIANERRMNRLGR